MVTPTQPLDTWALASLLKTPYAPSNWLWDMVDDARKNPTPHRVTYSARYGVHCYLEPLQFGLGWSLASPSDCEWIVPGTLKDTSDL